MEIKGSWLAGLPRWQESPVMGYPVTAALKTTVGTWEQSADAYLYLGPRDNMTRVATRLIWRVLPTETSFAPVEDHFPATSRGAVEIRWQGASLVPTDRTRPTRVATCARTQLKWPTVDRGSRWRAIPRSAHPNPS